MDRIRRFWRAGPGPDHPLTDEERQGVPATVVDEAAYLADEFIGAPFEPDPTERP
jgi:hypothetical protein